jgi:hypothetical protein
LPRRLDKLVATKRLTKEEADRLRSAELDGQVEDVLTSIRARHASARVDAAVDVGRLSRDEADHIVNQIRAGEHSPALRARVRRLTQADDESPGGATIPPAPRQITL